MRLFRFRLTVHQVYELFCRSFVFSGNATLFRFPRSERTVGDFALAPRFRLKFSGYCAVTLFSGNSFTVRGTAVGDVRGYEVGTR